MANTIQVNQATLASWNSVTSLMVNPGSVTLQGYNGATWGTIPADQYLVGLSTGRIRQSTLDGASAVVDWSSYVSWQASYIILNQDGSESSFSNELVTGASAGDGLFVLTEVNPSPVGVDGDLLADFIRFLAVNGPVYAAAGYIAGLLRLSSAGAALAIGNPPPTNDHTGTGFWWDRDKIVGLNAGAQTFLLSSTQGTTLTQVFTTPGANTWTKPAGAKSVRIALIGGGGGGASGAFGASPTGGPAGGGGGSSQLTLSADSLGATETVTVGAGGRGGAAQTVSGNPGNNGTAGGATKFGDWIQALGGSPGIGTSTDGGVGGNGLTSPGVAGGSYDNTATTGIGQDGSTSLLYGAPGGGGGGQLLSGVAKRGGAGGGSPGLYAGSVSGGAAGSAGGGAGGNGSTIGTNMQVPGTGGGGGGGQTAGTGHTGGKGGNGGLYGAGGGGGGACVSGSGSTSSGAGGNGANGIAVVITEF